MARPSPTAARLRGKIGALSTSINAGYRSPDDPELAETRRDLRAEILIEHVERVVRDFGPLSDEQKTRIASLLQAGAS